MPSLSTLRVVVVSALVVLVRSSFASGEALPVVASRLVTGPASHVDLTNNAVQPVTAWTLVVTTTSQDGTVHRSTETIDAYLSEVTREFAGSPERVDRLMPGQTREIALEPAGTGAVAEVTAVVLEDGTALGDPEILDSVFEHRAKQRDELREVVALFDAVLPKARGTTALEQLRQGFAAQAGPAESGAHQSAREAVDMYLQRATPANTDAIDQLIRKYADIVRREYELAERHSKRK
jgi:hypothetical protein